jgi:peptidoglycan/xylan/chitin deacetylase (PgdA/CDA1 family)
LTSDAVIPGLYTNSISRLNTKTGAPANPTDISRGVFGATVGIDRLLTLWDKYSIKTTWFTPAHSAESFPQQIRKIVEKGHEIGLHGYTHEFVSTLSEQQQRDVLEKSIRVLTDIVGKKPRGWTAPAWSTSKETIQLLEEFGIVRRLMSTMDRNAELTCIAGI